MSKKKKQTDLIEFSVDMLDAAKQSSGPLSKLDDEGRKYVLEKYRKFLALAKKYRKTPLAPTADIDEMWHIHMLMPKAYAKDCESYFGQILDHKTGFTTAESTKVIKIFDETAVLWKEEFGEEYLPEKATDTPLPDCYSEAEQSVADCFKPSV